MFYSKADSKLEQHTVRESSHSKTVNNTEIMYNNCMEMKREVPYLDMGGRCDHDQFMIALWGNRCFIEERICNVDLSVCLSLLTDAAVCSVVHTSGNMVAMAFMASLKFLLLSLPKIFVSYVLYGNINIALMSWMLPFLPLVCQIAPANENYSESALRYLNHKSERTHNNQRQDTQMYALDALYTYHSLEHADFQLIPTSLKMNCQFLVLLVVSSSVHRFRVTTCNHPSINTVTETVCDLPVWIIVSALHQDRADKKTGDTINNKHKQQFRIFFFVYL